jgi:hypothetical protein
MYFPEEVDPVLYIYNTYRLSLLEQIQPNSDSVLWT